MVVVGVLVEELVIDVLLDALLLARVGAMQPRPDGPGVSMLPIGAIGGRRTMCPRTGGSMLSSEAARSEVP